MTKNKHIYLLFLFLLGLCILQALYYYPELPEKVASHFDLDGNPNAWSSKQFFIAFYSIVTGAILSAYSVGRKVLFEHGNRTT